MYPLPNVPDNAKKAPPDPVIVMAAGLYIRSTLFVEAGMVVGQHAHDHAHATYVAQGRARGWKNGEWIGDKGPGEAFEIEAGAEHTFQTLESNTRLACMHDEASALALKKAA